LLLLCCCVLLFVGGCWACASNRSTPVAALQPEQQPTLPTGHGADWAALAALLAVAAWLRVVGCRCASSRRLHHGHVDDGWAVAQSAAVCHLWWLIWNVSLSHPQSVLLQPRHILCQIPGRTGGVKSCPMPCQCNIACLCAVYACCVSCLQTSSGATCGAWANARSRLSTQSSTQCQWCPRCVSGSAVCTLVSCLCNCIRMLFLGPPSTVRRAQHKVCRASRVALLFFA
jgi:hypothetical protein